MTAARLQVIKTYKLYINGGFPRSESGRTMAISHRGGEVIAHVAHASRKDLRDAVEAARSAQPRWAAMTPYNRGQILYRMAEMLESRRAEFVSILEATKGGRGTKARRHAGTKGSATLRGAMAGAPLEVDAAIDRLVCYAGWADKYAQVMGCQNPVAGPYYNFTVPEPTGIVGIVAPDKPALLGLVTLIAPPLCSGNAVVALASDASPLAGAVFAEVCATSDIPGGVINILTAQRAELIEHIANHREINAIGAANIGPAQAKLLELGAAENVKRVKSWEFRADDWYERAIVESPRMFEPFVEYKTIWHPSAV
jgi:acyl-CoA reductase-like NAD-dependent aldehyde dehydrogenase